MNDAHNHQAASAAPAAAGGPPAAAAAQDITLLRRHLFETLAAVREGKIELDSARAVNEIARTLVDTARVEVDFIRATDGSHSGFLEGSTKPPEPPAGVTQHRLR
jgi:hypothetical protein